jgi:hypothetical protein
MFEHFTSVACEFSQPLLFTPQKSTPMEVMLIFSTVHRLEQFPISFFCPQTVKMKVLAAETFANSEHSITAINFNLDKFDTYF